MNDSQFNKYSHPFPVELPWRGNEGEVFLHEFIGRRADEIVKGRFLEMLFSFDSKYMRYVR